MQIEFTVPGEPFGKQRPRHSRVSGTTYTPKETKLHEQLIQWAYRKAGGHKFPEDSEIRITIIAVMVGLDYQKPYHRHGKAFYRPYRNYFADGIPGNRLLNKFPHWIITKSQSEKHVYYKLTADGLKWLGRQLGITIKEERD